MSIIKVENLSKKYIIGHNRNTGDAYRYSSLRDTLAHSARGMYQRLRHPLAPNKENTDLEEFWALKDINFEIKQGDRVGIIGRNGAGKSTLLKILSRITEPTIGKITLHGRVASLLEVGTGFHPELTGRENIYLNGAVLGMSKAEIKKKFDEIVDFSGVEKFLDTPVKRYSSGMYVRLAFSVAAHLEPEILLVDEVLAVGDAEFQKKCLGKMEDVSREGRTVIFVSHNMGIISSLCNRGILMQKGSISCGTDIYKVINNYLHNNLLDNTSVVNFNLKHIKNKQIFFTKCWLENSEGKQTNRFHYMELIRINFIVKSNEISKGVAFHVGINTSNGLRVFTADSEEFYTLINFEKNEEKQVSVLIDSFCLMPGNYTIGKLMVKLGKLAEVETYLNICEFKISNYSSKDKFQKVRSGIIIGKSKWKSKKLK
ncbi:MAG TPA: ABC transporter ATP-binding protein [Victivallales bacterium]|nr:ABC transporter ATP-binding protein [Victivallales bacterium]